jgi:NADH-quinone oxidoreductase subunit M
VSLISEILLLALPLTPATGAIIAGLCPRRAIKTVRFLGWGFSIATLIAWIILRVILSAADNGLMVSLFLPWVPSLGIGLHFGLDQMGLMLSGLIASVGTVAMIATWPAQPDTNRSHVVFLLLAEAGMLGVVTAWDLILFSVFWEVTLVPFFFLMGRGPTRGGVSSATRFFITSVTSSVLMWVGVLMVVKAAGLPRTFDLLELGERLGISGVPAGMWLLLPAFLIRMAVVPLHTWFPVAAANVPAAAGIMLAGGVLPLGGYGLAQVFERLCSHTGCGLNAWLTWIGVVTALGGGVASMVQRDIKRLLAYVCLAQIGLALVGISFSGRDWLEGGSMMLVAAGLGGACLFLFAGVICEARGSQRISEISGLWRSHPFFAGMAFTGVASAAAIPGTCGFVGSVMVLREISVEPLLSSFLAGAILVVGASVVWAYRRILGGSHLAAVWAKGRWPRRRQVTILALLTLVIVLTGFFPGLISPRSFKLSDSANPDAGSQAPRAGASISGGE